MNTIGGRWQRHGGSIVAVVLVLITVFFSRHPVWVERYYSQGLYPFSSTAMRALFGWAPFSVGDLLYVAAGLALIYWTANGLWRMYKARKWWLWTFRGAGRLFRALCMLYLIFMWFWGLNYYRQPALVNFGLSGEQYTAEDVCNLLDVLSKRLHTLSPSIDSRHRLRLHQREILFQGAAADYSRAAALDARFAYKNPSLKHSLFGSWGKYGAYTGYYNPFSGEAQINGAIPVFLKPFVINHEIAHQLGFAKEDEANFVGFLVSRTSANPEVQYSAYLEMYQYTQRAFVQINRGQFTGGWQRRMPQRVIIDLHDWRQYIFRNSNRVAPVVSEVYDGYLKLNNQPGGTATYSEVVALLVGWQKKWGTEGI